MDLSFNKWWLGKSKYLGGKMLKKIFYNGKIYTVDKENTVANAVLVEDGWIVEVGTNEEILKLADEKTQKIDLTKKTEQNI